MERWKDYSQNLYNNNETIDNLRKSFNDKGNQNRIDMTDFETIKQLLNCLFSKKEILACKEQQKNSKASGVDMINKEAIKICLDDKSFLEALRLLANEILNSSKYSTSRKTKLIRPIHKKEETYLKNTTGELVLPHVWVNFLTIYS